MIIAATGHRPDKLGGYTDSASMLLVDVAVAYLSRNKPAEVITGMALGWDQAVAEACFRLKLPWTAAVPFDGQERKWPAAAQSFYRDLLDAATRIHVVSPGGYAAWKLHKRNEWMVDQADHVVALWDGSDGGTANCVRYAQRVGKPVTNLYSEWKAMVSRG